MELLGQLVYRTGEKGRPGVEKITRYGLQIQQVSLSPDGFWAERRLKQAGRLLARAGSRRVLVPEGFARWELLRRYGLHPVDPLLFLRAHTAQLVIAALRRRGHRPERCTVALRGVRVEREFAAAAEQLCQQVKDVCVSAPEGGRALCDRLRWEYGVAVRPDHAQVDVAVRFHSRTEEKGGMVLKLFPEELDLCGISVTAPEITWEETEYFPLLAVLWEEGRLGQEELEFT